MNIAIQIGLSNGAYHWDGDKTLKNKVAISSQEYTIECDRQISAKYNVGISLGLKEIDWALGNKKYNANVSDGVGVASTTVSNGSPVTFHSGVFMERELLKSKKSRISGRVNLMLWKFDDEAYYHVDTVADNAFWRSLRGNNQYSYEERPLVFYPGLKPLVGLQLDYQQKIYRSLNLFTSIYYEQGFLKIVEVEYAIIDGTTKYPMTTTIRGSNYGLKIGFKYGF